jgi:hypothetical protein
MASSTKAELAVQLEALRKALDQERANSGRLEEALTEALEQQAATSEILRVISSSPTGIQPTFEAIAAAATTLCDADSTGSAGAAPRRDPRRGRQRRQP